MAQRDKAIFKSLTIEQKAFVYDFLIDELADEGSYSILAFGYITSKVISSVLDLKASGKL